MVAAWTNHFHAGTIVLEGFDVNDLDAGDFAFCEAPVDDGGTDGI